MRLTFEDKTAQIQHAPYHPGAFLNEAYLRPKSIEILEAAKMADIEPHVLRQLVEQKIDLTSELAKKLSSCFGRTPTMWLKMQKDFSDWKARIPMQGSNELQKWN